MPPRIHQIQRFRNVRDSTVNPFDTGQGDVDSLPYQPQAMPHGARGHQGGAAPNMIDHLTNLFYDSKDGGIQWGGLAGAAIGGMLGWSFLGNAGGANSWLVLGGIAVATLVGAWAGNATTDTVGKYFKFSDKSPSQAKSPSQDKAQAKPREIEVDLLQQAARAVQAPQAPNTAQNQEQKPFDAAAGTPVAPLPGPSAAPQGGQKAPAAPK